MKFITKSVADEEKLKEIYRLRYKVYVREWGFEKEENHPKGYETDEFDEHSIHFATRNEQGELIGTIRIIVNPSEDFPIERHCQITIDKNEIPRERLSEISRLAISKSYRKRIEDKFIYGPDEERRAIGSFRTFSNKTYYRRFNDGSQVSTMKKKYFQNEKRARPEAVINLFKAVYHESKKRNITHWYAIMTKGLFILLKKLGIHFQQIGDPVDYHGIRTPYFGEIKRIENEVSGKNPELFDEFTRDI
jgi:N-acyl-L-homoserine lactone synthetase